MSEADKILGGAETCGNCRFGKRVDVMSVECHGLPPTPAVVATGQNLAGQPATQIALLFAVQPADTPRCALYQRGAGLALIGKSGDQTVIKPS